MECPEGRQEHWHRSENEGKLWPITTFWTTRDVYRYVCDRGFQKYARHFKENMITGKDLGKINAFDLQRIGVTNMEDAMRLSANIKKATTTLIGNSQNFDKPPNISYDSGFKLKMGLTGEARTPQISNINDLRLPYRDHGDRIYRYNLPVQSYQDHCMVIGRTDAWKLYNSNF